MKRRYEVAIGEWKGYNPARDVVTMDPSGKIVQAGRLASEQVDIQVVGRPSQPDRWERETVLPRGQQAQDRREGASGQRWQLPTGGRGEAREARQQDGVGRHMAQQPPQQQRMHTQEDRSHQGKGTKGGVTEGPCDLCCRLCDVIMTIIPKG